MLRSSKSGNSKSPGKKRLLPPSKTQFAWAMEQRERAKTYFHTRSVEWEPLGPNRAQLEAQAAELAAATNANAQAPGAPLPAMLKPTPTQRMGRSPSHLVFRTKAVSRTNKPK